MKLALVRHKGYENKLLALDRARGARRYCCSLRVLYVELGLGRYAKVREQTLVNLRRHPNIEWDPVRPAAAGRRQDAFARSHHGGLSGVQSAPPNSQTHDGGAANPNVTTTRGY